MAARSHPTILALDGSPAPMDRAPKGSILGQFSTNAISSEFRQSVAACTHVATACAPSHRSAATLRNPIRECSVAHLPPVATKPVGRRTIPIIVSSDSFQLVGESGSDIHARCNSMRPNARLGRGVEKTCIQVHHRAAPPGLDNTCHRTSAT